MFKQIQKLFTPKQIVVPVPRIWREGMWVMSNDRPAIIFKLGDTTTKRKTVVASGALALSGAASLTKRQFIEAGGVITLTGTLVSLRTKAYVPTGVVSLSGSAPITTNIVPPVGNISTRLSLTFVGQ